MVGDGSWLSPSVVEVRKSACARKGIRARGNTTVRKLFPDEVWRRCGARSVKNECDENKLLTE